MNDDFDPLWQRVGSELDAEEAGSRDDQAAAARVLARLLAELPAERPRQRPRLGLFLVAAALLVASLAAATALVLRERHESAQEHALNATKSAATAVSPAPSAERTVVPPTEPVRPPEQPDAALAPAGPAASSSPLAPTAVPSPVTAAELLSAAGQARRRGDAVHAIARLDELQARYPNSPEAHASDIALGMLQLQRGAASAGLTHFDRYLQRSPQGALAADALWGRAQALFALGRTSEAHADLSTLLERYPNAPYASAARAKLRAP